jgi:16S rRNA (guanine527-N7)-methyltransferase
VSVYRGVVTSKAFRERLARRANSARVTVDAGVLDRLETYVRLLAQWNAKVNLTSLPLDQPTDETFDRLLIEPLAAARCVEDSWSPWVDIGSGGGSPAIPLKLAKPLLRLTMVESKARKAAFLREAVRVLELDHAVVETMRFEELASRKENEGSAGLITLRAVRPDTRLIASAARLLRANGHLLAFAQPPTGPTYEGFDRPTVTVLVASKRRPAHLLSYWRSNVPRGTLSFGV